jgi:hypothetical protein
MILASILAIEYIYRLEWRDAEGGVPYAGISYRS